MDELKGMTPGSIREALKFVWRAADQVLPAEDQAALAAEMAEFFDTEVLRIEGDN